MVVISIQTDWILTKESRITLQSRRKIILSLGAKTADLYQKYEKDQVKVSPRVIGPIRIFVVMFVKNISFSQS